MFIESKDLQAEYDTKTNILSVGWRSNDPGGFVMTYRAVEASQLSLKKGLEKKDSTGL